MHNNPRLARTVIAEAALVLAAHCAGHAEELARDGGLDETVQRLITAARRCLDEALHLLAQQETRQ